MSGISSITTPILPSLSLAQRSDQVPSQKTMKEIIEEGLQQIKEGNGNKTPDSNQFRDFEQFLKGIPATGTSVQSRETSDNSLELDLSHIDFKDKELMIRLLYLQRKTIRQITSIDFTNALNLHKKILEAVLYIFPHLKSLNFRGISKECDISSLEEVCPFLRDGEGTLTFPSGDAYTGQWKNGTPSGFGIFIYKNGDHYAGHWKSGKKSGKGHMCFDNGQEYFGFYKNDRMEGEGYYIYSCNAIDKGDSYYRGSWKNGLYEGEGTLLYPDGCIYRGHFKNNHPCGLGFFIFADGHSYRGEWDENGKLKSVR